MSALDRQRGDSAINGNGARGGFRLDKENGKLMGVCSGIGNHFGVDTTLVRAAFVVATLCGFGTPVIVYLAIGLIAD